MTDWARLEDAYGRSSEVPGILEELSNTSAKKRAAARDRFRAHLVHQGSVYEATVAAIPHVIALVEKKNTPERGELLCLLEEAAIGEHTNFLDGRFEAYERGSSVEARCYTLVAKSASRYAALLGDRDPSTRAGAAFVVGWLPTRAKTTLPKIRARLRIERDNDVRAGLLLALGMLGTDADAPTLEAAYGSRARGGQPPRPGRASVLAAGAVGRVWLNRKTVPTDVRTVLDFCADQKSLRRTPIPWNWGDLAGLARKVGARLSSRTAKA